MDAGSLSLFCRLISMGAYSLLQYVSESFPWSASASAGALTKVREIAAEERVEVARFTRILQKRHISLPIQGAYPSHYTTMNFVALDYLLPKLIGEHEKEIAEIESKLPTVGDEEIRVLAQAYLDMKRRHLQILIDLKMPASN